MVVAMAVSYLGGVPGEVGRGAMWIAGMDGMAWRGVAFFFRAREEGDPHRIASQRMMERGAGAMGWVWDGYVPRMGGGGRLMARPRRRCVLFEGTCFDAAEEWLGG